MDPFWSKAAVAGAAIAAAMMLDVPPGSSLVIGGLVFAAAMLLEQFGSAQAVAPVPIAPDSGAVRELETLRAVVDGLAEGLWITGADGTIVQHNDALKEMLYAGIELLGHRPIELVRSAELQEAVSRACNDGLSTRLEVTVEGVRPRVLQVHVTALRRAVGGSEAVFIDVTDLRRLETVRKDFVANVSHELRTPITAIRGYAETLQAGALADPANAPKMVEIIHRQSERLSALVEDLLELSRIEGRLFQLNELPVDLAVSAQRAAEAVRPKAIRRNVTINLEVPPGMTALADERGVEQVLINLLDNAVKYTAPDGVITVFARSGAGGVVISVRDNGIGIEQKHLGRVFERFYRVDKGRSRDMGGTGLGLSIVKHLATAMHGDVRVESAPGKGSTFFVELPFAPASGKASPA
jgi:two-component system, OmpR family, phosphate regulon sensor histidine kinase PhoR